MGGYKHPPRGSQDSGFGSWHLRPFAGLRCLRFRHISFGPAIRALICVFFFLVRGFELAWSGDDNMCFLFTNILSHAVAMLQRSCCAALLMGDIDSFYADQSSSDESQAPRKLGQHLARNHRGSTYLTLVAVNVNTGDSCLVLCLFLLKPPNTSVVSF